MYAIKSMTGWPTFSKMFGECHPPKQGDAPVVVFLALVAMGIKANVNTSSGRPRIASDTTWIGYWW